jgi:hypothetical protein
MKKKYNSPEDFNYSYNGRVMIITGPASHEAAELHIPPEIDGRKVESIGNGAFQFCSRLKRISVPDTVTAVENAAFKGCSSLTEAELSSGLNSIGALAFQDCISLRTITISNHTNRIEMNSFRGCSAIENVNVKMPDGSIRSFAISSESDEAIWLYMRAILRATDSNGGYMDKYDATFLEIRSEDDMYRIAVHRLSDPYNMTRRMHKVYKDSVMGMIESIIKADRVDRLTKLGELGCIEREMLPEYIDLAGRIGGGCIAYLLEHQNRYAKAEDYDYSL